MATDAGFCSKTAFDAEHPKALAIYCSDGRFTEPVEELLRHLGHARIDTLTVPGGAALLNYLSVGFVDWDLARRATMFLVEKHHIEQVVLVAHLNCGFYRARGLGKSDEELIRDQVRDLELAEQWLRSEYSGVDVAAYFARPEGRRVRFDRVGLGACV